MSAGPAAALQPGDWAVVQIGDGTGDVIEMMQRISGGGPRYSKWVHAVYCVQVVPQVMIVEATPKGTKLRQLHYSPAALWWSSGRIRKTPAARAASVAAARASTEANGGKGVPYSFLDYAAIAARTWHLPAPGLQRYLAALGHAICSQDVDQFELDGGTHLFTDDRWAGDVPPWALAQLIDAP